MMNWLTKLMQGRHGVDRLCFFTLLVASIVSMLGGLFGFDILSIISVLIVVIAFYRVFSKNIETRDKENRIYLAYENKIFSKFRALPATLSQSKTYHHFKCPKCSQKIRVPKGRGKIAITCPKCNNEFIKKT